MSSPVSARVELAGDEQEDEHWPWGLVDFPVLPPIGSDLRIMDQSVKIRDLRVIGMRIDGVRQESEVVYQNKPVITLICTEHAPVP